MREVRRECGVAGDRAVVVILGELRREEETGRIEEEVGEKTLFVVEDEMESERAWR